MVKVAVFGAKGRMGVEVCRAVEAADDLELVAAIDAGDDRTPAASADVAIDFTVPDAVMGNIAWCIETGVHAVVGTTGIGQEQYDQVARDISAFLAYAAEPAALKREAIGVWVLAFLSFLALMTYMLKAEFWRDVH